MNRYCLALAALLVPTAASAKTWTVCSSGCDGTSVSTIFLTKSIKDGDTVSVSAGTYSEAGFAASKRVSVIGAGSGSTILKASSTATGTLMEWDQTTGTVTISGVTIQSGGTATRAVRVRGGTGASYSLSDVNISSWTNAGGNGAGLRVSDTGTTASISNATFTSDSAGYGGAIYTESGTSTTISGTTSSPTSFTSNTASYYGGAVYAAGTLTISGASFTTNTQTSTFGLTYGGGAVYATGNLTISGSTFTSNSAVDYGGAVEANMGSTSNSLSVSSSTFTSNSVTFDGGAIAAGTGSVTVTGSTFTSNSSTDTTYGVGGGGAIYLTLAAPMSLSSSTFTTNTAGTYGGGLFSYGGGTLTLTDNDWKGNSASTGGAILVSTSANVTAKRNWFCSNSASTNGGAVTLDTLSGGTSGVVFKNNLFVENTATSQGGQLATNSSGTFYNNDFLDGKAASASGGGVSTSASLAFENNIVSWTSAGDGVRTSTASGTYKYGDWYSNTSSSISGSITTLDSTNLTVDPSLYSYTAGSGCGAYTTSAFHLASGSSLINAGDNTILNPDGSRSDIGAFGGPDATDWTTDADGDGYKAVYDCNDADSSVHPGATETCNGKDDDCDKSVDEGTGTTYYADSDGDGYGNSASTTVSCSASAPSGYTSDKTDCDDTASSIHPGATETCNSKDDDCDGSIDEGVTTTYYRDADADGYGTSSTTTTGCSAPSGYVATSTDCNDASSSINPGATEVCNGVDDDCDGSVDEGGTTTFYKDADGDGYGDKSTTTTGCSAPSGYVSNSTDCDDTKSSVSPAATETCNSIDDDCDGSIDEGVKTTFYKDADGDGYGTSATTTTGCSAPSGYVANSTDCDDTKSTVSPAATETCNSIDDDCDGSVDEGVTSTYYADTDGDGYGNASSSKAACSAPTGYVTDKTDCDDTKSSVHPGASEVCNSADDDCDGSIDEGVTTTYYADTDGDGYGTSSVTTSACSAPSGYVSDKTDCNDASSTVHPGATETCNGVDDDCDGTVDEGVTTTYYRDADGDGFGDVATTTTGCSAPSGYVANSADCDDTSASIKDGITWYADADGDGYGDASSTTVYQCAQPSGYTADATDCDDTDVLVHPGATEQCNGVDDDCDGAVDDNVTYTDWYTDADGDGYGDPSSTPINDCKAPAGTSDVATDCVDSDAAIHPGATEACNGVDDDCDGNVDNGVVYQDWYADADGDGYGDPATSVNDCAQPSGYVADATDCDDTDPTVGDGLTWYADADGDGFGDPLVTAYACTAPSGYVATGDDCDDTDPAVGDGLWWYADTDGDGLGDATKPVYSCTAPTGYVADDSDCMDGDATIGGPSTWYADADLDGYGDASETASACTQPTGYVGVSGDCDDTSFFVSPGAPEQCGNGIDDDCDGEIDTDAVTVTWYPDADGDAFGDASGTTIDDCAQPSGYTYDTTDCDDADATVHPGAEDVCNGVDDDCDGTVDNGATISVWYVDADGDGHGDASTAVSSCEQPVGTVAVGDDCDDGSADTYPGAPEQCDALDNDCNGFVDDGVTVTTWYTDADGDGFGDDASGVDACDRPEGTVADGGDCDDGDAGISPDATEICDGVDQDCDGQIDDGLDATTYYPDADGDGYGDATSDGVQACEPPDATVLDHTDCNDADITVHPGAEELVNDGVDQDCDGEDGVGNLPRTGKYVGGACGCATEGGVPTGSAVGLLLALALVGRRRR